MRDNHLYDFDKFRLDAKKYRLLSAGELIALPPKAFELLLLLVENQGRVIGKEFLMETLWPDTVVEEANLTQNIYLLRKALGKTADGGSFIETLSKRGYKFVPAVHQIASEDDGALIVTKLTHAHVRITQEEVAPEPPVTASEIAPTAPISSAPPATQLFARPVAPSVAPSSGKGAPWRRRPALITPAFTTMTVVVILAAMAGVYFWWSPRAVGDTALKSIAVLPFKTIGAPGKQEFLGLGMADAILTRLGKTGRLATSPIEAVRRYADKGTDPLETGRALKAAAVLTGSVQQDGDRVRVRVQLFDVGDGRAVWAEQFDEQFTDIFSMQDQISRRVAGALTLKLTGDEQQRLSQSETTSLEAYELYLKGRYYWNRRTSEWVRKGIDSFEQATRLDPHYARAYTGLADSYAVPGSGLSPLERMPKAKAAAQQALALDESLAEAHTSLGFIKYKFDWDWRGAEESFKRAMELNPSYATAFEWYGEMLSLLGRFDEAFVALEQAERLDPLSLAVKQDIGEASLRARQFDRTLQKARELAELDPTTPRPHYLRWHVYQAEGHYDDAVAERLRHLTKLNKPPELLAELRQAAQTTGWQGYWRKELALAAAGRLELNTNERAKHCIYVGDYEQAFRWMEESFAERGDVPVLMKTLPSYDPLRDDPRFAELLQRAGLSLPANSTLKR